MEKIYKKIVSITSMVIVGVLISSCSSEDSSVDNTSGTPKTYSMVINASKSESNKTTRALSLDDNTLNATWATTENIYVTKSGTSLGTLNPQSSGATALLKGELTGTIAVNDNLTLTFPCSNIDYRNQDGTLATIASTFDFATATAKVTAISGSSITADDVTFDNQQAIVKFVLTNKLTGAAIDARSFEISDYNNSNHPVQYITDGVETKGKLSFAPTSSTWTANGGTGIIYMALRGINTTRILLEVVDTDDRVYYYDKANVTFENGKYYVVNIALVPEADATKSISDGNITVPSGKLYKVSGSSSSYTITLEDGACLVLNGVEISSSSSRPIKCNGDAYILINDGTSNTLTTSGDGCAGIQAGPSGKTLSIKGKTGTLTVSSSRSTAIGNGFFNASNTTGDIIITGGIINATGRSGGSGYGTGIGSGYSQCGNITINSGTITAIGGGTCAGIGSGASGTCGNITINGGTIIAKGSNHAAGIGSGYTGTCGTITIGSDVTSVEASSGVLETTTNNISWSLIGAGNNATCGTVTIDGVTNATTSSTFTNYSSVVSQNKRANDTWTLTHK